MCSDHPVLSLLSAGLQRGPAFHQALSRRGFVADASARVYRRGSLTLASAGRWLVMTDEPEESVRDLHPMVARGDLGLPGLWKWSRAGAGGELHRVFEIPAWVIEAGEPEDPRMDGRSDFEKLLAWAIESRARRVPSGWVSPEAALVESWLPRGGLTVQSRGLLRQGELLLEPNRWALRIPLLASVPAPLPRARRAALLSLAEEAQERLAMARVGLLPGDESALVAEVDFTGAPYCESLFSAGLDVLRHVVAWLVETVDVLGDPGVVLGSLASDGGNTNNPNERRVP